MDHYKTLGLRRTATKLEIKEAFRRCALRFHPDRHSQSTKQVRDGASVKFKQASEAYEVLIDDLKRADYDFSRRSGGFASSSSYNGGKGYGYGGGSYYRPPPPGREARGGFDVGMVFRYVTRRGFLLNVAFASVLFGGAFVMEKSMQTLWRLNNSGKSFEETIKSVDKSRKQKEN